MKPMRAFAARRSRGCSSSRRASSRSPQEPTCRSRWASGRCMTCAALADVPPLPSKREHDDIVRRLKAAQSALTPKVQELREAEEWKRFANAGVQEQLCARMEALRALEDPEALATEIRDLQQQWRQVADVPRAQGEALVAALQGGARRRVAALRSALRRAGRSPRGQSRGQGGLVRARRSVIRVQKLDSDGRRDQAAAGRVEDDRCGDPRPGKSDLGALPRRLRSLLHAAPRGSRPAQDDVGGELRGRRKRWRCKPKRSRSRPSGTRRRRESSGCRRSGRRSAR